MQLKHRGKQVQVTLTILELRNLAKAKELLETIALLPCEGQEAAKTTAMALGTLADSMAKEETPDTEE